MDPPKRPEFPTKIGVAALLGSAICAAAVAVVLTTSPPPSSKTCARAALKFSDRQHDPKPPQVCAFAADRRELGPN
jgi:hypothetical protein